MEQKDRVTKEQLRLMMNVTKHEYGEDSNYYRALSELWERRETDIDNGKPSVLDHIDIAERSWL